MTRWDPARRETFKAAQRWRRRTFRWSLSLWGGGLVVLFGLSVALTAASRRGEEFAREAMIKSAEPAPAHVVMVSPAGLAVDGVQVVSLEGLAEGQGVIAPLIESLGPAAGNPRVVIRAEKQVNFRVVKRVMATCSVAGFTDIQFRTVGP